MARAPTQARFPDPPDEYSREYMDRLVREMQRAVTILSNPGPIVATSVRITDLPTSAAGLLPGQLWNDSGTIKVAP